MGNFQARYKRLLSSRGFVHGTYRVWIALPYPLRKPATAMAILGLLLMKRLSGVDRQDAPTPTLGLGNLSYWGVPEVRLEEYTLRVTGLVDTPLEMTLDELEQMTATTRSVRMDCVGGFRNNTTMRGIDLATMLEAAGVRPEAETAIFRCADGYYTTHRIRDLLETGAFLAYEVNGERIDRFGFPLRLAAPGTYGYKWAKWVVEMELVGGTPKGYWERLGLPTRGRVGDIW